MGTTDASPPRPDGSVIKSDTTVQRWLNASGLSNGTTAEQLAVLARFLTHVGIGPDELVAGLFRQTDVGPRIRLKRRREVMEQIDQWEKVNGRPAANVVRAFLVQNGVALTASPIW